MTLLLPAEAVSHRNSRPALEPGGGVPRRGLDAPTVLSGGERVAMMISLFVAVAALRVAEGLDRRAAEARRRRP